MKLFKPQSEDVTVEFLDAEGEEFSASFRVRERRLHHAAEFLTGLEFARLAGAESRLDGAANHIHDVLRHVLHKQIGGDAVELTGDVLDGLAPSVVQDLLDLQGSLYGLKSEENLVGKKYRPLIDAIFQLRAVASMSMSCGPSPSTPVQDDTPLLPESSGDSGISENSTTSFDSSAETSGESESSSVP